MPIEKKLIDEFLSFYDLSDCVTAKEILYKLLADGCTDSKIIRNKLIVSKYYSILQKNGNRSYDAIYLLCEDFNIAETQVKKIIYSQRKNNLFFVK